MIKIITLNTWKCEGKYQQRIHATIAQLQKLNPDFVFLQEVFQLESSQIHTALHIARSLGMYAFCQPARLKKRSFDQKLSLSYSGLALLARHPISEHSKLSLPTDERDGERIAQIAVVSYPAPQFVLVNLHLTHLRDQDSLRSQQLITLLDHIKQHFPSQPIFLGGDFNATPNSKPITMIEQLYGAQNSFQLQNIRTPIHHLPPTIGNTCVDFIFALPIASKTYPQCINSQLVLNQPTEGVFPSDHAGVMAIFNF